MEAVSVPQPRTQVNFYAGCLGWVSVPRITTPNIRSFPVSSGSECGGTYLNLTPRDLLRSGVLLARTRSGKACGGNNNRLTSQEKSDHLIVALKSGNADGAKGVTS
jgi:hypothetical protein